VGLHVPNCELLDGRLRWEPLDGWGANTLDNRRLRVPQDEGRYADAGTILKLDTMLSYGYALV
jgi:hypothetical protein